MSDNNRKILDPNSKLAQRLKAIEQLRTPGEQTTRFLELQKKLASLVPQESIQALRALEVNPAYLKMQQTTHTWFGMTSPIYKLIDAIAQCDTRMSPMLEAARQMSSAIERAQAVLADWHAKMPVRAVTHQELVKLNWYVSDVVSIRGIKSALDFLQGKSDEEREQYMLAWAGEHFNLACEEMIAAAPARAHIIQQAIDAHSRGAFYLSVPVFFSQADGLIADANYSIFHRSKPLYETARKLKAEIDACDQPELDLIFLAPLSEAEKLPISLSENKRSDDSSLNRHAILHGESLDYGTESNSFKAFYFMAYALTIGRILAAPSDS